MRTAMVIVIAPGFDGYPGLGEAQEDMLVKALVAQTAIERFNECILHWLAGRDVVPVEPPDRPVQYRHAGQSQPLWLTITLGPPRSIIERSSSRTTRTPPIEVSTTPADISSGSVDQRTLYIREPKVDDQQNRAVHRRRLLFEHVPPPVVIGATESATDGLVRTIGVLLGVHHMDGSYGRR
jgi:hypothetical protein